MERGTWGMKEYEGARRSMKEYGGGEEEGGEGGGPSPTHREPCPSKPKRSDHAGINSRYTQHAWSTVRAYSTVEPSLLARPSAS